MENLGIDFKRLKEWNTRVGFNFLVERKDRGTLVSRPYSVLETVRVRE